MMGNRLFVAVMQSISSNHPAPLTRFPALDSPRARVLLSHGVLALMGGLAGWASFEDTWLIHRGQEGAVAQGFLVGAFLLALAWRSVDRRTEAYALMVGWYAGAASAIPSIWVHFFGGGWLMGTMTLAAFAALMALPYTLVPRRWPRLGVIVGLLLTTVPPLGLLGMASPLIAAGAMFPGLGIPGLLLLTALFALSGLRSRLGDLAIMAAVLWGAVNIGYTPPAPPDNAWGATTWLGKSPVTVQAQFARQDELKSMVRQTILQGAKLIVLPEGANPQWDDGQAFYWSDVRALAAQHHAQVLIGVYAQGISPSDSRDGLFDLGTGKLYPAMMPMPIGMWRPWVRDEFRENFPIRWDAPTIIPTVDGPAAYSICYENLILWPLLRAVPNRPRFLISAANQWFAQGNLSVPQMRSIEMQARLYGLPLLQAVNWPEPR